MHEQVIIDSLEFAEKSREIRGTIAHPDLPRLADMLAPGDGALSYVLKGNVDVRGKPALVLNVKGVLGLLCQRCLKPLEFRVDTVTRFVLVPDEAMLPEQEEEEDDADYIVADPHLDVLSLVEDEVLLALPLAPLHDDANCNRAVTAAHEEKESPFKVLQGLKLKKN